MKPIEKVKKKTKFENRKKVDDLTDKQQNFHFIYKNAAKYNIN